MQGEIAHPHGDSPKQYPWSWAPWIYEKTDGYAGSIHAQIRKCALSRFQSGSAASLRNGSLTIKLLSVDESFIRVENWGAQQEYAYYWHHQRWERKHCPSGWIDSTDVCSTSQGYHCSGNDRYEPLGSCSFVGHSRRKGVARNGVWMETIVAALGLDWICAPEDCGVFIE